MDAYISMITLWPVAWVPDGWLPCDGRSIPVNQNQALYSLIGNTYGGDYNNFKLPDLRGRLPLGVSVAQSGGTQAGGTGLANVNLGTASGAASIAAPVGAHSHVLGAGVQAKSALKVGTVGASQSIPPAQGNFLVASPTGGSTAAAIYQATAPAATVDVGTVATAVTGATDVAGTAGNTLNIMNPFVGMQFIICVNGLYPTRP